MINKLIEKESAMYALDTTGEDMVNRIVEE